MYTVLKALKNMKELINEINDDEKTKKMVTALRL